MIPQEKIEQAAKDYAVSIWGEVNSTQFINAFSTQSKTDFTAGVRFAEEEMKRKAPDFLEWVEANCSAVAGRLWEFIKDPYSELFTSAELYDKYNEERNNQ